MIKYEQIMFLFYLIILLLLILRPGKIVLPIFEVASADTILFWDGYEAFKKIILLNKL